MFDPEKLLDPLTREIEKGIARVGKAKTVDARLKESEVLLNLGKTMDVFLSFTQGILSGDGLDFGNLLEGMDDLDEDDDDDEVDGDIPF